MSDSTRSVRVRREPPQFRRVELRRTRDLSPHLRRITLGGVELAGFSLDAPAASVRLLLPREHDEGLVVPGWTGNEFLHDDGQRPTIRTYTPRHFDPDVLELDLDVVLHDGGAVPRWLASAEPGAEAAISGPGRGYDIDRGATSFVLAGDESAIPAMSQLLEQIAPEVNVAVVAEVARPDARHELPPHPRARVEWLDLPAGEPPGTALVAAVEQHPFADDLVVWAAGEAAAMHRIRRHLFESLGLPRTRATVRGYWKAGRAGDDDD